MREALDPSYTPETSIKSSMKGWVDHLRDRPLDSDIPVEFQELIMRLCSFTAAVRTQTDRDPRGRLLSPPVIEVPSRLIRQTVSTVLSLCAVLGINKPTEEVHEIIKKVLRDTSNPRSYRYLIFEYLAENRGMTAGELVKETGLHKDIIGRELSDLRELKLVTTIKKSIGYQDMKAKGWILRDELKSQFEEIRK